MNSLAAEVTALALNIGFDNTDVNFATATGNLKDLYITSGPFMGWTVQQLYNAALTKLGGCSSPYNAEILEDNVENVNLNYQGGTVDLGFLSCTPVRDDQPGMDVSSGMKLYPNPTNGQFMIELKFNDSVNADAKIEVINMLGQTVVADHDAVIDGIMTHPISVSKDSPAGMLFVRVTVNNKVYIGQIVYQQ